MKSFRYAALLALGYAALAGTYIHVSSRIAARLAHDLGELERLERFKGFAFVVVTAILLWLLACFLFSRIQRSQEERWKELQAMMLVQSKASAGELAASVAHDFNNMLMVLRASVDEAAGNNGQLDPTTLKEMNTALDGARNLTARLARAARGDRASRRDSHSLRQMVTETTRLIRRLPRLADRRLEIVAATEARALLDPVQVDQIVVNLLLNAADACGAGGHIRVEVGESDDHVWLAIDDTGPGFPDSQKIAMFEPFRSTKTGGLGLGLLSVRASVDAGGGELRVEQVIARWRAVPRDVAQVTS